MIEVSKESLTAWFYSTVRRYFRHGTEVLAGLSGNDSHPLITGDIISSAYHTVVYLPSAFVP